MTTLSELTVQVLAVRLTKKEMSLDELQKEMVAISTMIKAIDEGTIADQPAEAQTAKEPPKPEKINFKHIFKKDEVICLLCNKGFKTLKRHLSKAHQITDKEYRVQFNISSKQPLVAKAYSDKKKADAVKNNLGEKMQAGRKAKAVQDVDVKTSVPTVKEKSNVPVVKTKAPVPAKTAKKK